MSFLCRSDILLRGPGGVPVSQLRQDFTEVLLAVCSCMTDINHAFEPGLWCITRVRVHCHRMAPDGQAFRAACMPRVRPQTYVYGICMLYLVLIHTGISYEIFINKCSFCLCPTGRPTLFFLNITILSEIDYCAPGKWNWVRILTIHYITLSS